MHAQQINRYSGKLMLALALIALVTVLIGYTRPPLPDEGALAHIFQLAIVLLAPVIMIFFATADWTQPARSARPLAIPATAVVLAFAALYYLEHYFYPQHYR